MSKGTIERPVVSDDSDVEDLFMLDITFIETGPNANTVIAMTDDGCGSSCPSACTTSASA